MTEPKLRTPILSETIKAMHLDADAKFLSQQEDALKAAEQFRAEIKRYRQAQEKVTLKEVK